ncbi:aspartate/glutamate racemase family protein [Pedobacter sp. WC2423]|uniref:aspartate/glutamate racemase family protein n=1 Tax=Pedobacter sp. WC2423 TaxID=3234142 RepID=UPI003465FE09
MGAFENDITIGLVGGMGPQAGLSLFNYILHKTKAKVDQDHLSTILMSFPKHIVDRTAFLNGSELINPALNIAEVIKKLEMAGAVVIGIACNTSHAPEIYDVILKELDKVDSQVSLVHMPLEACRSIAEIHPAARRIGLLTTNGTHYSGLYADLLKKMGYDVILPDDDLQNDVIHRMIYDTEYGLKTNVKVVTKEVRELMETAMAFFNEKGTDVIILGCTDFSIMNTPDVFKDIRVIDSSEALANALVREAANYSNKMSIKETFFNIR